jgi:hypothetical protein
LDDAAESKFFAVHAIADGIETAAKVDIVRRPGTVLQDDMPHLLLNQREIHSVSLQPPALVAGMRSLRLATSPLCQRGSRFFRKFLLAGRLGWTLAILSRILLGLLIALLVPPGTTIVLGANDTVERRSGGKIKAKGCYRDAVRSSKSHVIRCFGLKWDSMMLLVPVMETCCGLHNFCLQYRPWNYAG